MMRVYKTVRLAYETKLWLDQLIIYREKQLQQEMKKGIISELEAKMQNQYGEILDGISFNIVMKVSSGSVLEQAYRYCEAQEFSNEEWSEIERRMIREIKNCDFQSETTVTPRLYLDENILDGLEQYRYKFKINEKGKSLPRLSYIIKLVVFAFLDKLKKTGEIE